MDARHEIVTEDLVVKEICRQPKNIISLWCSNSYRAILAEFFATISLLFFGCMTCIPIDNLPMNPPLYGPLGFGLIVILNIQIFGHISGAHMNPVVTFSAIIWGNISLVLGIAYIIAQFFGAIIGYGLLVLLSPANISTAVCITQPHARFTEYQALGVEILLTAGLVLANCAVWDHVNVNNNESISIKFGLIVAALSVAGGPLTGASMNPARSLGPAIWTNTWNAHWVYYAGPFLGSASATVFYKYVFLLKVKEPETLSWTGSRCRIK